MNKLNLLKRVTVLGMFLLLADIAVNAKTVHPKPFVIPELKEWSSGEGYISLHDQSRIVVPRNMPEAARIARLCSE